MRSAGPTRRQAVHTNSSGHQPFAPAAGSPLAPPSRGTTAPVSVHVCFIHLQATTPRLASSRCRRQPPAPASSAAATDIHFSHAPQMARSELQPDFRRPAPAAPMPLASRPHCMSANVGRTGRAKARRNPPYTRLPPIGAHASPPPRPRPLPRQDAAEARNHRSSQTYTLKRHCCRTR